MGLVIVEEEIIGTISTDTACQITTIMID